MIPESLTVASARPARPKDVREYLLDCGAGVGFIVAMLLAV